MGPTDGGVCRCCLEAPTRGREWALTAEKVRSNPENAKRVWRFLPSDDAKRRFISLFGLPPGEVHPDHRLQLIK